MGQGSTTIHAPYAAVPDRWHRSTAPGVAATRPTVPATSTPASHPLHPSKLPLPPPQATTFTPTSCHLHPNKLPPASQQAATCLPTSCHLHLHKLSPPPQQAVTSTSTSCHLHLNKLSHPPQQAVTFTCTSDSVVSIRPDAALPPLLAPSPECRTGTMRTTTPHAPRPRIRNQESGIHNHQL